MKMAKILFRCDGSNEIGFGHLNRCLNIAQWLRGKFEIGICTKQTKEAQSLLRRKPYDIHFLDLDMSPEEEKEEILGVIREFEPKVVVHDVKDTTEEYMGLIKELKVRTVNFDDLGKGGEAADVLIDANRRENKKKLFGPRYVSLHPDYMKEAQNPRRIHKAVKNITIAIGGGDPLQVSDKLLEIIEETERKVNCLVVLGPTFEHSKELKKKWKKHGWIHFAEKLNNLVKPFTWCDMAIVNGGLTMYEAISLGTPTLVVSQNQDELKNVKRLERKEAVLDLGLGNKISLNKLNKRFNKICDDADFRQKLSTNGKEIVDGEGLFRVIEIIERVARKR